MEQFWRCCWQCSAWVTPPAVEQGKASAPAPRAAEPAADTLESVASAAWESNPTVMAWRAVQLARVNGDGKLNAEQIDALLIASGMPDFFLRAGRRPPARPSSRHFLTLCVTDPLLARLFASPLYLPAIA